jgi:hypothetical protein
MDHSNAESAALEATPIFTAYRRGYDPVQVDRYVADQQRRLDDALTRASEAERKLAAAVGQLRELHRRVAVLESEDRSPQPAPLDALGERVQRILQEAWEGAYALRQQAETEAAAMRAEVAGEAAAALADAEQRAVALVSSAERRSAAIDAEIERRRNAWNARLEEDRARAVAQIAQLHQQRTDAVGELLRLRAMIEKAVQDLGGAGTAVPAEAGEAAAAQAAPAVEDAAVHDAAGQVAAVHVGAAQVTAVEDEPAGFQPATRDHHDELTRAEVARGEVARGEVGGTDGGRAERVAGRYEPAVRVQRPRASRQRAGDETVAVPAVPVQRDDASSWAPSPASAATGPAAPAGVFDFEEEQPS